MGEPESSLSSSSQTNINDLHDELLAEILRRLHCLLAIRCRYVSKRWNALISDISFIRRFICRQHRLFEKQKHLPQCSFILRTHQALKLFTLEEEKVRIFMRMFSSQFIVFGESNGWVLCSALFSQNDYSQAILFICYPLTKYWCRFTIPLPEVYREGGDDGTMGFICDPYYNIIDSVKESVTFNSQCRFEIVYLPHLVSQSKQLVFTVDVFSSTTRSWTKLLLSCCGGFQSSAIPSRGVEFNGKLHFLGCQGILVYEPYKVNALITSQQPIQMHCRLIDFPGDVQPGIHIGCLGPSCGSLRITQQLNGDNNDVAPILSVWKLQDYQKGTWCLQHRVNLNGFTKQLREAKLALPHNLRKRITGLLDMFIPQFSDDNISCSHVVAFHPYNEDIVYLAYNNCLASYNLKKKTLEIDAIGDRREYLCRDVFSMVLPWWPGPAPS